MYTWQHGMCVRIFFAEVHDAELRVLSPRTDTTRSLFVIWRVFVCGGNVFAAITRAATSSSLDKITLLWPLSSYRLAVRCTFSLSQPPSNLFAQLLLYYFWRSATDSINCISLNPPRSRRCQRGGLHRAFCFIAILYWGNNPKAGDPTGISSGNCAGPLLL